ncbi:MAG: zinc metalloprotease, partial [Raineya sp.]
MKKLLALGFAALFAGASFAQRSCHTMDVLERQKQQDPGLEQRMQQIERITENYIRNGSAYSTGNERVTGVVTIPVVVHVIYNSAKPQENISDAQIQSQIAVLNEDYRRTNADHVNVPSLFSSLKADTEIRFVLASQTPTGAATTGITRKSSTRTSWGTNDDCKKTSTGGVAPWDASRYLNIWVCNIGGGILGYAQFPGGSSATDGVVISPQYFGSSSKGTGFYLSAPFDKGRTATHEVGH